MFYIVKHNPRMFYKRLLVKHGITLSARNARTGLAPFYMFYMFYEIKKCPYIPSRPPSITAARHIHLSQLPLNPHRCISYSNKINKYLSIYPVRHSSIYPFPSQTQTYHTRSLHIHAHMHTHTLMHMLTHGTYYYTVRT